VLLLDEVKVINGDSLMDPRYVAHTHEGKFFVRELSLFGRILEFLFGGYFAVYHEDSQEKRYYSIAFTCGRRYHYLDTATTDPQLVESIVEQYLLLQADEQKFSSKWQQAIEVSPKVHVIIGAKTMFDNEPAQVYHCSNRQEFVDDVVARNKASLISTKS
jgi:hypothetical protein